MPNRLAPSAASLSAGTLVDRLVPVLGGARNAAGAGVTNAAPTNTAPTNSAPANTVPTNTALRSLLLIGAGVAFLALLAQLRVQIGPVPVTGQTLGVLLLGAAYGARLGVITTGAYALLGVAGLPLFAGGGSGFAYLLGPTGGYLVGFVVAAGLLGALAQRGWDRTYAGAAGAMLAATLLIYVFGVTWLTVALGGDVTAALSAGVVPFVAGDLIKLGVAVTLLPSAWRLLGRK